MHVLSFESYKRPSLLQGGVSDPNAYYSCDDDIPAVKKVIKSDKFHHTQDQSLQIGDMGNIACGENSEGIVDVKILKRLYFLLLYAKQNKNCTYGLFMTFGCGS